MEALKPRNYIETRFEKREGYPYPQPVEYCNGIRYSDYDVSSFEKQNWGDLFWESYWFNSVIDICRYGSDFWNNKLFMDETFEFIYKNKPDGDGSCTPLFNFEIYLIEQGYKMESFDLMNAMSPCFVIIGNKCGQNCITDIKGCAYTRRYVNATGRTFCFGFGVQNERARFNFYFLCFDDNFNFHYQVPGSEDKFKDAADLKLIPFEKI